MNKLRVNRVLAILTLLSLLVLGSSCVNKDYDMSGDRLNLEVTAFQEGLTLPLGSTEKIFLSDLLVGIDTSFFSAGKDGIYSVNFSDSLDMSDQLAEITDMIEIPDVEFTENISFELDQFDISDVKLDEQEYSVDQEIEVPDAPVIDIPPYGDHIEVAAGLAGYAPDPEEMSVPMDPFGFSSTIISFPDNYQIGGLELSDIPETSPLLNETHISLPLEQIDTEEDVRVTGHVAVDVELPSGIESIEDILLNPNARIRVTFELGADLLCGGVIVPDVEMDFSEIFDIAGSESNIVNLRDAIVLNSSNGFSSSCEYGIDALIIEDGDWVKDESTGKMHLEKSDIDIPVVGHMDLSNANLETSTYNIWHHRSVDMEFTVEILDLEIEDLVINIEPIEKEEPRTIEVSTSVDDIPAEIKSIQNVVFTEESGITLNVTSENLRDIDGLDVEFTTLEINFPEQLIVEGADENNSVVYEGVDLEEGLNDHIRVFGMNLPDIENGAIIINEEIEVFALVTATGRIHSSDLPEDDKDVKVLIDVTSEFEISDYDVEMDNYYYELEIPAEEIEIELPSELAEQELITIYPEGTPVLEIAISIPELPLEVTPAEEGIEIFFPEMIRFDEAAVAEYNFNEERYSISFASEDEIPELIELPIVELWIIPELDETDGKYYTRGEVKIVGGVMLHGGFVDKAQIEELSASDKTISVVATVPEIVPQYIDIDVYKAEIAEVVPLDIMDPKDVPAELVSIGIIKLEDANLDIMIDASDLPDLGSAEASLTVDLDVQLPDMIKAKGATEDGLLKVVGKKEGDFINIPPIEIEYLDLSEVDIKKDGISGEVSVNGIIKLSNALLEIDEWLERELTVAFEASMVDIIVSEINARVDYKIDPVEQEVDLSDLAGMLKDYGVEATLDFNRAFITVEVETNLGVPVDAALELIPYRGGRPDTDEAITASLTLNPSPSADDVRKTVFYVSNTDKNMPDGYEFVEADILGLLKDIPEKLEIKLVANTDTKRDCILEPTATYVLKANYLFYLPLEFGEDFEVVYEMQMSGLPAIIGEILSTGNKIKLGGEIVNSLPLALDLKLNFLDEDGDVVPVVEGACTQIIKSCDCDGNPMVTPLGILVALEKGVTANITGIELSFRANAGDAVGVAVTKDAFLQATLQAILPEGVTVDLKELLNTNAQ